MNVALHKIQQHLFYIFIFLLPWQTIWIVREVFFGDEKWQYGTVGIYASDIILIAWIILSIFLYKDYILAHLLKKRFLTIAALLFVLWCFLSIFWSGDKALTLYFALKIFFALSLFFLVQCVPLKKRFIGIIFVASASIQSIIGIAQFSTQHTFMQKLLGLTHYDVWRGGTAIINTADERWLRIYGGMAHPNIFGGLLCAALLIALYLFVTTKEKNTLTKSLLLVSIALFTTNVLLTFSRITWVAVIVGIALMSAFIIHSQKHKAKILFTPLLLMASMIFFLVFFFLPLFSARITHDSTVTHNSFTDRYTYMQQAQHIIAQNPFFGSGGGNYTQTASDNDHYAKPIWYYQPVHNIYMLMAAELGIIGVLLFSILFFFIFYELFCHREDMRIFHITFAIIVTLILFIGFFDHWPWSAHFGTMLLFLASGLAIPKERKKTPEEIETKKETTAILDPLIDQAENPVLPLSFFRTTRYNGNKLTDFFFYRRK